MLHLFFNLYNILVLIIGGYISYKCLKEYEETKSRPLLNSLPGVFTSLGLLGTFVSICYSLYDIKVEIGISELIRHLIPAFTSSIVGLLCALGVTVWTKKKFAQEDAEDSSRLKNKSPEDYIRETAVNTQLLTPQKDLLVELVDLLKSQEEKNREYNDRLNENIGRQSEILKEFIDGFVRRMDEIFNQMQQAIERQVQSFGEEQFQRTSTVLTSITSQLSTISTQLIDTQRQSVETLMNTTNAEIGNISRSVAQEMGNLTTSIQQALVTLGTSQSERLSTIISNYDTLAERLSQQNTSFAERFNAHMQEEYQKVEQHNAESIQNITAFGQQMITQMQQEYQKVQQFNADSMRQMIELRDVYKDSTEEIMSNTLDMNNRVTADLRNSMTSFVTDIQSSIAGQCTALSSAISQNVESLNNAYRFIESLVAEIRQNYDQAAHAFGDAVKVAHRTNESADKIIKATNQSLLSVEGTNKKVGDILDLLSERQENIEKLTKQINSVSSTIVQLQRLESMLNKIGDR